MTLLDDKTKTLINTAKAWHRADETNLERRETRLHQAIEKFLEVEAGIKERQKGRNAHEDAAAKGLWLDKEGSETPLADLEGKHLYNIRRKLNVDNCHYDGVCNEVATRALKHGSALFWASGIPFTYEGRVQNGDQSKVTFRNVLTRKLQFIEVDRKGFVLAWSGYQHHGLSSQQANALHDAWKASGKN